MLRQIRKSLKGVHNQVDDRDDRNIDNNLEQNLQQSAERADLNTSDRQLEKEQSPIKQLTDPDYEFLFDQLLEGVAHGWHDGRIIKFFERLETRGNPEFWISWLQRFGRKILTTSVPDRELAARMLLFGQITQSAPSLKDFGLLAYQIGHQLIIKSEGESVWDYSESKPVVEKNYPQDSSSTSVVWEYLETNEQEIAPTSLSLTPLETTTAAAELPEASTDEQISSPEPFLEDATTVDPFLDEVETNSAFSRSSEFESEAIPDLCEQTETPTLDYPEIEPELSSNDKTIHEPMPALADENIPSPSIIPVQTSTNIEQNFDSAQANANQKLEAEIPSITTEQLLWILQQDANLVEQMSAQLNLDTKNPQLLMQALIERLSTHGETEAQKNLALAESWFELGLKQANLGNMEEAIASWDRAIAINPNLASAWHNRGSALGHLAKFTEAIASFNRALKIDPQDAQTWNDRAHALIKLKKWEEAVASWDRALEIEPNCYQFWYNRGYALEKLGRSEESIASYEQALQMQPDVIFNNNRYINLLENS
jgi:tetratricopeptide (TPR) repeat protein